MFVCEGSSSTVIILHISDLAYGDKVQKSTAPVNSDVNAGIHGLCEGPQLAIDETDRSLRTNYDNTPFYGCAYYDTGNPPKCWTYMQYNEKGTCGELYYRVIT